MRLDRKKLGKGPNKWNEEVGGNILSSELPLVGMIKEKTVHHAKKPEVVVEVNNKKDWLKTDNTKMEEKLTREQPLTLIIPL